MKGIRRLIKSHKYLAMDLIVGIKRYIVRGERSGMRLVNRTKHSTSGLRVMFYDLAEEAHISTRGISVEVRRAIRNLNGICYPATKKIILWLLNDSKTKDISYLWLHELEHTTPKNRRLYSAGHARRAQIQANNLATKISQVDVNEIKWRNNDWRLEQRVYPTKAKALMALQGRLNPFGLSRTDGWHFRISEKSKRDKWQLEMKYFREG